MSFDTLNVNLLTLCSRNVLIVLTIPAFLALINTWCDYSNECSSLSAIMFVYTMVIM